jgi:hypothetical protein
VDLTARRGPSALVADALSVVATAWAIRVVSPLSHPRLERMLAPFQALLERYPAPAGAPAPAPVEGEPAAQPAVAPSPA